jgi:hypothetical protein
MNIEILNWSGSPREGGKGGVKRTGRDEPVGIVMQGNNTRKLPV